MEWDTYDYFEEYFRRMVKEKKHLKFRKWLRQRDLISKGMQITSYTPDYLVPLYRSFLNLFGN